jgi:putative ABC transport system permease protein
MKEKVLSVLKEVGLEDKINAYPKALSGGQKQRVAIARALISSPYIVLADEPTGALDSKSAESIMSLLKEISTSRLVVMVTHNKEFAYKYGTRIISMLDGQIVDDSDSKKEVQNKDTKKLKKVKIPFLTSFKWGFKNLFNKKVRSALTVIAGSVGIIGMGLILSLTSGIYDYIGDAQGTSLGKYPVTVTSYTKTSSEGNKDELIEYPDTDYIIVEKGDMTIQEHYNYFQNDFFTYLEGLDPNLYTIKDSNSYINFQVITNNNEKYEYENQNHHFGCRCCTFDNSLWQCHQRGDLSSKRLPVIILLYRLSDSGILLH